VKEIALNARVMAEPIRGIQRYLLELMPYLGHVVEPIAPEGFWIRGKRSLLWEQMVLPKLAKGRLLWSPSNDGPINYERQVVTVHDLIPLEAPSPEVHGLGLRFWLRYRLVLPKVVRKARAVIADSHFTKQRLVELLNVDPEKIHVVHLGVSGRFRPHSREELASLTLEFGLAPQTYYLVVGATEKRKNLERLLKAWQIALERLPEEVKLAVTGPRELEEQVPPRVVLLGKVSDEHLPALYAGALCNVHVAYYEGFGLPPLEAMASGTPVIAGNRTSLPEVVGGAAIQVDPFSVEAIASALVEVGDSSTLREELRQKGFERAREFTWQKTARETLRVLEQAARL